MQQERNGSVVVEKWQRSPGLVCALAVRVAERLFAWYGVSQGMGFMTDAFTLLFLPGLHQLHKTCMCTVLALAIVIEPLVTVDPFSFCCHHNAVNQLATSAVSSCARLARSEHGGTLVQGTLGTHWASLRLTLDAVATKLFCEWPISSVTNLPTLSLAIPTLFLQALKVVRTL